MQRERASHLVREIAAEIVRGSDYAARPWETIVVVADHSGRRRLFGYCFWDDDWEAATPDGFRALLLFGELRDATAGPDGQQWAKALMRIRRDGAVDVELDHTGERWVPVASDPEGFARSLLTPTEGTVPLSRRGG